MNKDTKQMLERDYIRHRLKNPYLFTKENQAEFKKWEKYWEKEREKDTS